MSKYIALMLTCASAACSAGSRQPTTLTFCDAMRHQDDRELLVRIEAHLIAGNHGSVLVHGDCPAENIIWTETPDFRASPEFPALERVVSDTFFQRPITPPQDVFVDVEGRLRWVEGSDTPMLEVLKVHEFHPSAAALPYVNDQGELTSQPP